MAIHIDIYAHLRNREVIKEGERLLQLIDHYENEANRRARRGAQGRSKQIVAAQDKVDTAYDGTINKIDSYIAATRRLEDARASLTSIENRAIRTEEDAQQQTEDLARARQELASATKDLVYKGQQLNRAVRDETRARRDLNDESKKHTKNAAAVTRITKQNKREFANLAGATTKARNQLLSLNAANQVHVKDNEKVTRGLRALNKATKNTTRERKKYKDLLKTEGVTAQQLEAQTLRVRDAFEAESYAIQDLRATIGQAIGESKKFNTQQARAMTMLGAYNSGLQQNDDLLKREIANNGRAITSTRGIQRVFDQATDSVGNYRAEHDKLIKMIGDSSTSSTALESQIDRTGKSYVNMERRVRDATKALNLHLAEEAKSALQSPFGGKGGRRFPDPAAALARNLGALTPLGTVTPGLLLPLGSGFFAIAAGAAAAAQSVLLLPAAATAAGAGLGVLAMATAGVSDAFTAMMDYNNPEKFAEALRMMSPAAQQFMLSVQQLLPVLREVKNGVQDAFFAGIPQVINGLAHTYLRPFESMAVGVASVFNKSFKSIADLLQSPRGQSTMAAIFDGIVKSFEALQPMLTTITDLFLQLSAVGMQVFPTVIKDISDVMAEFGNFINNAAASGDLKRWMTEGWEALKALGSVVVYTGKMLYDVFGLHGPDDIKRFKETLFGLIDGFGAFLGGLEKFFHAVVTGFQAIQNSKIGQVLGFIIEKLGGIENLLMVGGIAALTVKLGLSFYKMFKFIDDGLGWVATRWGPKISSMMAGLARLTGIQAIFAAAGNAGGAAAAAGVAAGGAKAGTGFASAATKLIKGAGWIGVGMTIADMIAQGLRDGKGGIRDALADGLDPGKVLNPDWWLEKYLGKPTPKGSNYAKDWYPKGDNPAGPAEPTIPLPWDPPRPIQGPGIPPGTVLNSDGIPVYPDGGLPVPTPNPGGGSTPNIPYGQYSLDSIPLGQFPGSGWTAPDPRSMVSQLTPHQIQQGKTKGYGYVVDPQQVFDKESALQRQRAAVEEARARLLELQADNQATEQAKLAAQANIVEQERSFIKTQVEYLEAQRGTWKKINESIKDQSKILDGLGAEIDADFGISKGLPGIAENIVKFLANITAAPLYGQLAAQRAAGGDLGGGKGLIGAAALSGVFGPQFMQPEPDPVPSVPYTGSLPSVPGLNGAPIAGAPAAGAPAGYTLGLNPKNVSTAGLKPQSMALLSLIQGMPQFKGVPLTSAYRAPGNPADRLPGGGMIPWHPNGQGLDFGLNANDPAQSALGDQLKTFLEANKEMFGINHVLWKTMQGGNHYDHLHVGLNGSGNGRPDTSPLMQNQALSGIIPPAAGGVTSATLGGTSIPLPLPVIIVGGGGGASIAGGTGATAYQSANPTMATPPAGTPNGPSPAANTPIPVPPAGTPGGIPGSTGSMMDGQEKKVWTVNPDGTISWRGINGNPTAPPKGQSGAPATTPPTPAATPMPSPGQGGPIRWPFPLSPGDQAPAPAPTPAPAAAGLPLAPGGYSAPGTGPSQIGAVVGPPQGTGGGFGGFSGGIMGAAQSAVSAAAGAAGMMGGMGAGGPAASALAQIGIEELNRAIAFAGQAAGIGVSGLMETFLPTGGSDLANNNWFTRLVGGVVGMRPLLPNFANISGAAADVQNGQDAGGNAQGGPVNVTQNNYNPTGNSTTSDLERLTANAAAASMPAMGAGR